MNRVVPVLFVLVLAGALGAEEPGDQTGWHEVRPGETLEGITQKYLGSPDAWRDNWKLNPDIQNPHKLVPGQRIRVILARTLPARYAKVQKVTRRVEKKPDPLAWITATAGDALGPRDGIHTFERSSAELTFNDKTSLVLTESSIVFLREAHAVSRNKDRSRIEIVEGQADLAKPPPAPSQRHDIEITIGTASITPGKTTGPELRARMRNDANTARLMAYRGSTNIAAEGKTVAVPEGMGSSVSPGAAPSPPERLLPAPVIAGESRGSVSPRPVLRWKPVRGAASYVVEICRDSSCADLVERALDLTGTEWKAGEVAAGDLFWRVTARSPSGLDGYASAAAGISIAPLGGVVRLEDGDAFRPLEGVEVTLYRDGGDREPSGIDDTAVVQTKTSAAGAFRFSGVSSGDYWVVVDSKTISAPAWAEQTAGPAGSLCADGAGNTRRIEQAGPCFGGRRGGVSDDANGLGTAEHVALVSVDGGAHDLEFGFSFDVVTTTRDADDDRDSAERFAQGSLRQFVMNANGLPGRNAMRFVPATVPENQVGEATWWTVTPESDLPPITDDQTTIDGKALSLFDGKPEANRNPGCTGTVATTGVDGVGLINPERAELEIDFRGIAPAGVTTVGAAALRNLAIFDAAINIQAGGPLEVENVIIGLRADGSKPPVGASDTGIIVGSSLTRLRRVLVAEMPGNGILVESANGSARIDAEHLEVRHCGFGGRTGDGVALHSDGSRIARSVFVGNVSDGGPRSSGGSAIEIQGAGSGAARSNSIESSTFLRNRKGVTLSSLAESNLVRENVFADSEVRDVVVNSVQSSSLPRFNVISENWFDARGAIDIDRRFTAKSEGDGPDGVPPGMDACADDSASPHRGIRPPNVATFVVTQEGAATISGSSCAPGRVEVYAFAEGSWRFAASTETDGHGLFEVSASGARFAVLVIDHAGNTSELVEIETAPSAPATSP